MGEMADLAMEQEDLGYENIVSDGMVVHDYARFEDFKDSLSILRAKIRKAKGKKVGLIAQRRRYSGETFNRKEK